MPFGFHKPTKEFSDEELTEKLERADMNSPVSNFVMAELTRRSLIKLDESIKKFTTSSDQYSKILVLFTAFLLIAAIFQLVITVSPPAGLWRIVWLAVISGAVYIFHRLSQRIK